ncbi:MAG: hypothetical protein Q9180_006572 [Flavoplaca navasiana]
MLTAKALLSLLAACATLANGAAVPAAAASPAEKVLVLEGPFPLNSTIEGRSSSDEHVLVKRAACNRGAASIYLGDIDETVRQLQNDYPDQLSYLPARSYVGWNKGEARICAQNRYYADNTRVKRWEAGWAANVVRNECCPGSRSYCGGGSQQGHGDSGLAIDISAMHKTGTCNF